MKHFYVKGKTVCKTTFMTYYDIKKTALSNLIHHMSEHGPSPRVHGNKGRRPKHSLNLEDVQRVVHFLLNMSESIGVFYPAAPRGNDNVPVVFLPSHFTKLGIYKEHEKLSISTHPRCIKLSAFKII
ncbi:hypothetical protein DPMN_164742 [Dreissena polymorpha]|uniref:Uncharacterized protein n=1 Tax=Dreissena polymorpha TaxID=45954 RepID=A0A9D4ITZ3_DREPO|nr:hypothetical protein DPMN_164742 [Dreissena polymorpha]